MFVYRGEVFKVPAVSEFFNFLKNKSYIWLETYLYEATYPGWAKRGIYLISYIIYVQFTFLK